MDQQLPGYVLRRRIGAGATAEVYRAEPIGSPGRIVAIKRLRVDAPPRAIEELRREAEALGRLAHPSLVRVLDVVPDGDRVALVLPFAPAGSLADRLATVDGGLAPIEVADLGARLGSALAAAHNAGLVHRDVKPANVLFDGEGQPLLADFGMARLRGDLAPVAGTAEYVDPAAVAGAAPDPRTDVYGLGVTLYEALAGVPPYAGSTPRQTLAAADRGIHVPLTDLADAPARLVTAVERAMHRDPAARHATASDLAAHLDEVRRQLGATGPAPSSPAPVGTGSAGVLGASPTRRGPLGTAPRTTAGAAVRDRAPGERTGTRIFGPGPPQPAAAAAAARSIDRRLLAAAALLALLVPLGVAVWLTRGQEPVELTLEDGGGTVTGPPSPSPGSEPVPGPGTGPDPQPGAAPRPGAGGGSAPPPAPPACDDEPPRPPPDATILDADVEGRGCTVPVAWDGARLDVPLRTGEVARYDLGADPDDVLLLGDWNCDGRAAPALYRPADGQLFVFEGFLDETAARGVRTGIPGGTPVVVVEEEDGCERVEVEPPGS
jgi:tRNA A-37 threonylcarbamoyl transferase component Bud32